MMADDSKLPLAGVRVIDLSTHAVGPFATQVMAGLGATVLKVERGRGDLERFTEWSMFLACNRGKHSIVLDLHTDADRRVAAEQGNPHGGADCLQPGCRPAVEFTDGISITATSLGRAPRPLPALTQRSGQHGQGCSS
jgi:crotonobetainyl-CoA:carnitine CoA-transferase CaiB-like acyl-CoA transferase